jgi:hypothetical protein
MKRIEVTAFLMAVVLGSGSLATVTRADDAKPAEPLVPLVLDLPSHTLKGTPDEIPFGPHIEPLSDNPPAPLHVPKGLVNVAAGKPVTSSVPPYLGELVRVTDGKKEVVDDDVVEFRKGVQWVQIDLGKSYPIYAIVMWHDHRYVQVMHDVILQVSDDPTFKSGVTTLFNNDIDNSAGLGVGTDREYFEMHFGKAVPAKGVKARYVRGYTKGSSLSSLNAWQELEVYARPDK